MPGSYKVLKEHTHTQDVAATTWNIVHNVGGYPIVDVYTTVGAQTLKIIPLGVNYVDENTITVVFSSAKSGVAKIVG